MKGLLANTLNGGLSGMSLAAGLGTTSGSSFDAVGATSGGSVTYDTTHTRGVGVSAKHVAGPGSDAYYEWNRSFGTQTKWYGRVYVWFDSLPNGDVRLVRAKGGNTLRFAIDVMHGGQLRLKDASNQTIAATRTSILAGSWVRIEWGVNQTTGQVEVRVFNSPNVTTPTETIVSATGLAIGASTDTVQIGRSGTQAFSTTFWTDDPAIATSGFIGPVA